MQGHTAAAEWWRAFRPRPCSGRCPTSSLTSLLSISGQAGCRGVEGTPGVRGDRCPPAVRSRDGACRLPPPPSRATPEPQCGRVRRYKCDCDPGWSGANCDVNNDECASNPCVNGGTCKDMTGGYVCTCREGFSGEWQLLEQSGPGVGPGRSPRGAAALTAAPSPGPNCQTNVNECASSPCLNQGTCIDDVAGYTCNCLLPYTGEGGAWQGLGWPCLAGLPQGSALSLGPSPCRRHCRLSTQRRGVPGREFSVRRPPLLCLRSLSGR